MSAEQPALAFGKDIEMKIAALAPAACLLASLAASSAFAMETEQAMKIFALKTAAEWLADPLIVQTVKAQNETTKAYTEDQILAMDALWRSEVGTAETPTISSVLDQPASALLGARVAETQGQVVEAFVMDARGLNVAASAITSDYWQGDEDKFLKTFALGSGSVHVGEIEFDESTQMYLSQVSFVILDPITHYPIGAMTLGLNAEAF
jgi:hypothetical protein